MVQRTRIPVLLLTGFLGSGKTSLLSKWLRAPEFSNSMVIVNELGEVGIDDRLVQFSSEAPILLENGCACCEAAEDLNATLERLFWQRLHRQIPRFEWMLIETTGIADPAPIMAAIGTNDLVAERYSLAGVVTAFDARRGPEQLAQHPECRNQIMQADAVILTKMDLASVDEAIAARAAITSLRRDMTTPDIPIFESAHGSLPASVIVEALKSRETLARGVAPESSAEHSPDVTSAFAALAKPVAGAQLEAALATILQRYGKRILRLKGVAHIDYAGNAQVVQATPGEPIEYAPMPVTINETDRKSGLTIIAQFVPAELVARDFLSMLARDEVQSALPVFPQRASG